jgi:hypothetical protein
MRNDDDDDNDARVSTERRVFRLLAYDLRRDYSTC